MATTKTLTPTNQAITLAAFTEKPDNRTNVTNDDKLADAVNTLNSNFTSFLGNDVISDCNSETATGFKKAINSTENTPYSGHFVVFTFQYNQNEMIQFALSTTANALYFRYYNGSWQSWKMLGWNS